GAEDHGAAGTGAGGAGGALRHPRLPRRGPGQRRPAPGPAGVPDRRLDRGAAPARLTGAVARPLLRAGRQDGGPVLLGQVVDARRGRVHDVAPALVVDRLPEDPRLLGPVVV